MDKQEIIDLYLEATEEIKILIEELFASEGIKKLPAQSTESIN
jgi:hypothetical protein